MKKRLLVVALVAMFLAAAAGAQAAAWPPKTLAFQWQNNPNVYTVLTVKQNGSAKMANRTVKSYLLSGFTFDATDALAQYPIGGYGYLDDDEFNVALSGTLVSGGVVNSFVNLEGFIFSNGSGIVNSRASVGPVWGTGVGPISIMVVPANTLNFPLKP